MIAIPARNALKRNNGFVCISCLLKPTCNFSWQRSRRHLSVIPTPDPSVAAALYADLDENQLDGLEKSKQSKPISELTKHSSDVGTTKEKKMSKPDSKTVSRPSKNAIRAQKMKMLKPKEHETVENQNVKAKGKQPNLKKEKATTDERNIGKEQPYLEKWKSSSKGSNTVTAADPSKSSLKDEPEEERSAASSSSALSPSKGGGKAPREKAAKGNTLVGGFVSLRNSGVAQSSSSDGPKQAVVGTAESVKEQLRNAMELHRRSLIAKDNVKPQNQVRKVKTTPIVKDNVKPLRKIRSTPPVKYVQTDYFIEATPFSQVAGHRSLTKSLGDSEKAQAKTKTTKELIESIEANKLSILPLEVKQPPVPSLSYGLERVLFNPGVYFMQDPRSRVYNFDPYLENIMPVSEFDFNALKQYITSSRDQSLTKLAEVHGKRYVGSSSSMTGVLAHFHFLLSQWREISTSTLSREFPARLKSFTLLQRCPSAIFLKWKDGTYAIDADKEFASANILSMLGKSMEKLLTLDTADYERYRKTNPGQISNEERNAPESFHYSTLGDFLMRSQLDAFDARLPGTGMFDLKTRAVVSIRMDAKNYELGSGYEIRNRYGEWESFEREYYDMIRAAFLKYSLQVRMGRMDGIFVAFHNTERIFGFQYISLPEMDAALHGPSDVIGDQEFKLSLDLLNKILDKATKRFPEKSIRIHFETREAQTPFMYVFAEPVSEDQIHALQSRNDAEIEKFERDILGLNEASSESDEVQKEEDKWEDIQAHVQEAMDKDERSLDPDNIEAEENIFIDDEAEDHTDNQEDTILEEYDGNNSPVASEDADIEKGEDNQEGEGEVNNYSDAAASDLEGEETFEEDEEEVLEEDGEETAEEVDNEGEEEGDEAQNKRRCDIEANEAEQDREFLVEGGSGQQTTTEVDANSRNDLNEQGEVGEVSLDQSMADPNPQLGKVEDTDEIIGENSRSQMPETVHKDEKPSANARGQSGIDSRKEFETYADSQFLDLIDHEKESTTPSEVPQILALTLTVRNKVNDKYVLRPQKLGPADSWSIEYSLAEVLQPDRAWSLYQACQLRRKNKLQNLEEDENAAASFYVENTRRLSSKGKAWRKKQDQMDEQSPKVVLGQTLSGENLNDHSTSGPGLEDSTSKED